MAALTRVCIIVTARPSWAKLEPVCAHLQADPRVELQLVVCASALIERYGKVLDIIRHQGYAVAETVWSTADGATVESSVLETASLLGAVGPVVRRLRPDVAVVCADRHEVLAAATAAAYQHIALAHLQGGERSGSIDDKVRDAVTALADLHFPATARAAARVRELRPDGRIYTVGCPSIDCASRAIGAPPVTDSELGGAGRRVDLSLPFGIVLQHPDTRTADAAQAQMATTLEALPDTLQWVVFWPGQDAGMEGMSKAIRQVQDRVHTVRTLPPARFLRLLTQAAVLVGNSSAGIREASYLGVSVVNIGSRQEGRERAANVVDVPHVREAIAAAIQQQIAHGPDESSDLYGTGDAGRQIAEVLACL